MAPAFSVIIPTRGRPDFLAAAIDSVISQTFTDFECIVVDDASPDAQTLPRDDARVRLVVRETNGGPAAARNTGITASAGRYVAFLDDDDVWLPDRLSRALETHERAPVAVCWQGTLAAGGTGNAGGGGRVLDGRVADTVLDGITPHVGATSVDRERIPLFDERYATCEDVDWWLRLAADVPVATTQHIGLLYRLHDGPRSITGPQARVDGARLLLDAHADYFRTHPRAHAFRLKRLGLAALQAGDRALARRCFARSFRLRPDARTAWHAMRALVPSERGMTGEDLTHV